MRSLYSPPEHIVIFDYGFYPSLVPEVGKICVYACSHNGVLPLVKGTLVSVEHLFQYSVEIRRSDAYIRYYVADLKGLCYVFFYKRKYIVGGQ